MYTCVYSHIMYIVCMLVLYRGEKELKKIRGAANEVGEKGSQIKGQLHGCEAIT